MSDSELSKSQAAWNDFADRLKTIGEKITGPTGARNERERAEGYRYLLRLISAGHELDAEFDRSRPSMQRLFTPTRKFKGDGTDTLYYEAKLDESLDYELTVRRGDALFFSVTVYAHDENGAYYIVDNVIDEQIDWDEGPEGETATIRVGAARPANASNFVELKGARPILFTREYFPEFVHTTDEGRYRQNGYSIRCLAEVAPPAPLDETALTQMLERVTDFVDDASDVSIGLSIFAGLNTISLESDAESQAHEGMTINDGEMVVDPDRVDGYSPEELAAMIDPRLVANNLPGPGIQYIGAWFKLRDDEAIVIEGRDVPCRYWSCQILTRYLESGDYRYHRVGLNDRQVKLSGDGSFVIYASHENPGVDNWVCTQGYSNGHILIRTLLADPLMEATFKVVKLDSIRPETA